MICLFTFLKETETQIKVLTVPFIGRVLISCSNYSLGKHYASASEFENTSENLKEIQMNVHDSYWK